MELLAKRLNELQGCVGISHTSLPKCQLPHDDSEFRVSEIIAILQKHKQAIPDICCLHSPKLRRLLMKNSKFLNESLEDVRAGHSHKEPLDFMVFFFFN